MEKLITNLIQAQKEMSHAKASETNPAFKKSKYVPYEKLMDYVKEHLNKHGIYIQQIAHEAEGGVCVETVLHGHGSSLGSGKVFVRAEKQTPHGYGSALTYARRYSLSLATSSGADKDDDGNQAEADHEPEKQPATKPVPIKQPPKSDPKGSYVLQLKGATIVTHSDSSSFLAACRSHLANPQDQKCKDIFANSKQSILEAQQASQGDQREAFDTLVSLYGA